MFFVEFGWNLFRNYEENENLNVIILVVYVLIGIRVYISFFIFFK